MRRISTERVTRLGARLSLVVSLLGAAFAGLTGTAQASTTSWHFTVYYTAVESLHHGTPVTVRGCPILDCAYGHTVLGSFPRDFVQAVEDEGTGRITSGPHAGQYLEWSDGVGYWLDTAPRDSYGHRLVPFKTAAADASALARGSHFVVTGCGHDTDSGDQEDPWACRQLRAAHWVVADQFTPGLGGRHHVDLYIGEEHGLDFEDNSPLYLDASGAHLTLT
jgi:hypothetical protein